MNVKIKTILLSALVLWACQDDSKYFGRTEAKHGPDEIWTNLGSEPEYLDPGMCSESAGGHIITQLFSGLTQQHPKTLEAMPDIAEGWDTSTDGKTWTFYIRKNLTWSDGHPLNAHDYEWSWKRVLNPELASKYAAFMFFLQGGEAFNQGAVAIPELGGTNVSVFKEVLGEEFKDSKVEVFENAAFIYFSGEDKKEKRQEFIDSWSDKKIELRPETIGSLCGLRPAEEGEVGFDADLKKNIKVPVEPCTSNWSAALTLKPRIAGAALVGLKATDKETLVLKLVNPTPYLLDALSFYTTMPVPRHLLERLEKEGINSELWIRPEYSVTNGPYILKEWKFRREMVLERNSKYWDQKSIRNERVKFLSINNTNTNLNLYKAGEIDWIGENQVLPNEFMHTLREYGDFHGGPYLGLYWYWLNTEAKPLDNILVRRALNLAIDREKMVKYVTRGGQIPMTGMVPSGLAGYEGPERPKFDPKKAKALLKEAGYEKPEDLPTVTLSYNTSEGHKQIAVAAQQMWKENLGINVEIENLEWKVYLKKLQQMDFDMGRMGWIGDYPDPNTFLEVFTSTTGNNHSNWKSPEYDQMLKDANATLNRAERMGKLKKVEQMLLDVVPAIPIYVYARQDMWKPYLGGIWHNLQNNHALKYMYISETLIEGEDPNVPELLVPISKRKAEVLK